MKFRRLLPISFLAAFLFFGTSCTDGSFLDQSRLTFRAVDTELAKTPASLLHFDSLTATGEEVMAVASGGAAAMSLDRLMHSKDSGRSWTAARFDGDEDPRGYITAVTRGPESWLALVSRNDELFPYLSGNGLDFEQAGDGLLLTSGTYPLLLAFAHSEWTLLSGSSGSGAPQLTVHHSTDGGQWTETQSPDGLRYSDAGLKIVSAASNGETLLLAGQHESPSGQDGTGIRTAAYASEDGGLTWTDISPDASRIAPSNNGFRTVIWDGSRFQLTGFGWPVTDRSNPVPHGLQASWLPGGAWDLALDKSWSDGTSYFPTNSTTSGSETMQAASHFLGKDRVGQSRLLIREPGEPWKRVTLPPESPQKNTSIHATAIIADGALAAAVVTDKGNNLEKIWHIDPAGTITDRTPFLPKIPTGSVNIAGITSADGRIRVFGNAGSQPAIWESDGGRDFSSVTTLALNGNQNLKGFHAAADAEIAFGTDLSQSNPLSVTWSRRDDGQWESFSGDVFGGTASGNNTPVQAALAGENDFIVGGSYVNRDDTGISAGLAVSGDGRTWAAVKDASLLGTPGNSRGIYSLVRTSAGTVFAGGYLESSGDTAPAVWASSDTKVWAPVTLEIPEGYDEAWITSLSSGPSGVVAVVAASKPGVGQQFATYLSSDEGKSWSKGTTLPAPAEGQHMDTPHVVAVDHGYVLLATLGAPGAGEAMMLVSSNGKDFAAKDLSHNALTAPELTITAIGAADGKLLVAGLSGPLASRKSFAFEVGMPSLEP